MKNDLTIAALQHVPVPGNIAAALKRLNNAAAEAAASGCSLLVVPECSITGYNQPVSTMQQVALSASDQTIDAISDICRNQKIAIAYGFAERAGDEYFNCVQITDASGTAIEHQWMECWHTYLLRRGVSGKRASAGFSRSRTDTRSNRAHATLARCC